MSIPHPPIIIAAFGTTSRARSVYAKVDEYLKKIFPCHEILWGYSSRIVRHKLQKRDIHLPTPTEMLEQLASKGHSWAVVQSFNIMCGHEFQRLRDSVQNDRIRVSIGHSLLCGFEDFNAMAKSVAPLFTKSPDEAVVLVGHGTDHCAWSVYPALEKILRNHYGNRAFVGIVEGAYPDRETVIDEIRAKAFKKVRLVPCMLTAGVHFAEDLAGDEDSWKTALVTQGIEVALESEGLGSRPEIIDIFASHIRMALDVIPNSAGIADNPLPFKKCR